MGLVNQCPYEYKEYGINVCKSSIIYICSSLSCEEVMYRALKGKENYRCRLATARDIGYSGPNPDKCPLYGNCLHYMLVVEPQDEEEDGGH
jgi:hypothetical protein